MQKEVRHIQCPISGQDMVMTAVSGICDQYIQKPSRIPKLKAIIADTTNSKWICFEPSLSEYFILKVTFPNSILGGLQWRPYLIEMNWWVANKGHFPTEPRWHATLAGHAI